MSIAELKPRDADEFERMPPHDLEAEQRTLGGMLLSPAAIDDVDEIISPGDHYRPAHQVIHEVILELNGNGNPVDAVTVADALAHRGDLVRVGGGPYLHTLIASVPTAANAGYYARIVRDKAILRRVIAAATTAIQQAYAAESDADDIAERAAQLMDAAAAGRAIDQLLTSAEMFTETLDALEKPAELGMPTGFTDIDAGFTGLQGGQLGIIAARPGMGKTLAAVNVAEHVGQAEDAVYFSLEMRREELMHRRIAAVAQVELFRLTRHELDEADWERINRHASALSGSKLLIDDNPITGLAQVKARVRSLIRAGKPPKLVVVDLLGLMQPPKGRQESRQTEVAALSRGLKLIAREFNISVIAVVQVNRGPEGRSDKKPMLSDLRESGQIEADADWVFLLHRDDYYERESPRAGEADFIVAKQRQGPVFTATLACQSHYGRFMSMAKDPDPAPRGGTGGHAGVTDLDTRRRLK